MTPPTTVAAGGKAPGRPVADSHLPGPGVCGHWVGAESRYCRATKNVRQYIPGHRCPAHTPAAVAGQVEPQAGPGWPVHRREAQE